MNEYIIILSNISNSNDSIKNSLMINKYDIDQYKYQQT